MFHQDICWWIINLRIRCYKINPLLLHYPFLTRMSAGRPSVVEPSGGDFLALGPPYLGFGNGMDSFPLRAEPSKPPPSYAFWLAFTVCYFLALSFTTSTLISFYNHLLRKSKFFPLLDGSAASFYSRSPLSPPTCAIGESYSYLLSFVPSKKKKSANLLVWYLEFHDLVC